MRAPIPSLSFIPRWVVCSGYAFALSQQRLTIFSNIVYTRNIFRVSH